MSKFFDKLPFRKLVEAKIPSETITKYPILGKLIVFTNQIVCVLAVVLLMACFSGNKNDKNVTQGNSPALAQAAPAPAPEPSSTKVNPESDFTVTLTDDGKGAVITNYVGKSTSVVIPSTIQGMPVREIERLIDTGIRESVAQKHLITSVVIPEGVTLIGVHAFENFSKLSSVTLPSTLEIINDQAFSSSPITDIKLPAGLKQLWGYGEDLSQGKDIQKITYGNVFSGTSLTSFPNPWPAKITVIAGFTFNNTKIRGDLIIPEGITFIGYSAFGACKEITSVTLPSTIKVIEYLAFSSCSNLTTVNIPDSVKEIKFSDSFQGCSKLSLASQAALRQRGYKDGF
jgi:hypothetical protein